MRQDTEPIISLPDFGIRTLERFIGSRKFGHFLLPSNELIAPVPDATAKVPHSTK
jgi:hypothetical protein